MNNMVPINTSAGPARNGGHSRAYRRRLMALLRLAHSVLGMKRKRLALGISGIGGLGSVVALAVAMSSPASAQAIGGGIATGTGSTAISATDCEPAYPGPGLDPANTKGQWGIAIGCRSFSNGVGAMALGYKSWASGDGAVAVGGQAQAYAEKSTAIGGSASASLKYSSAFGAGAQAHALGSTSLGSVTYTGDGADYAVAVGYGAHANALRSMAIGNLATSDAVRGVSLGDSSVTAGSASTALGFYANASANNALAAGSSAKASGISSTAIGNSSVASAVYSTALGVNASATGNSAIGLGRDAAASGSAATAIGTFANASVANSIAIGTSAKATEENSVALGYNSVTRAAVGSANTIIAGNTYTFAGRTPASVVSIGAADSERQLVNLAAGQLSTTSTDAVNGSQLFASNQAINLTNVRIDDLNTGGDTSRVVIYDGAVGADKNLITLQGGASGTKITNLKAGSLIATSTDAVNGSQLNSLGVSIANVFGSPATFNTTTGAITGASFTVGGDTYTTIGGAITAVANSTTNIQNTLLGAGWGALTIDAANPRNNTYGGYQVNASGKITNPSVNYVNNTIGTANSQVVFDVGSGNSTYFVDPLDRSKGRLPAGTRLSNVATGILETDATNVGQVQDLINAKGDTGTMVMASRGLLGAGSGGSGIVTTGLTTTFANANFYQQVRGRGDSIGSSPPSDTAKAAGAASVAIGSDSVTTAAASGGVAIGIQSYVKGKDSVAIGSGSTATDDNVVSVGTAGGVTWNGMDTNGDPVTFNNAANTRRIVNMAAGFNDTDAVNVSQLKGITDIIGGGATIDGDGKVVNPTYTIGGNTYTTIEAALDGIAGSAGGDALQWDSAANGGNGAFSAKHGTTPTNSKITNLADGTLSSTSTDAVTGKQLNDTNTNVTNITTNINNGKVGPVQRTATADKLTLVADGKDATDPGNAQIISNLAKGSLTATSTEAVNGSQINTLASNISDIIGGGSSFDPATGKIKDAEFTVGGNTYTNIGDTFGAVDSSITNIDNSITNITKGKAGPVQRTATANQLTLVADGKDATDPGNAQVLGNLAKGSLTATSTEAVNGAQINTLASNISDIIGGGSSFDPATGKIKDAEFTVGGNTYTNIGDTFGAVDSSITNIDNSITNITKGKAGPVQRTATANQLTLVADGKDATDPGNAQVLGNLANGTVNAASKQAVNGSQLYGVSNSVAQALGGGSSVNTDGTIKKPSYSIGGTDYTDVGSALTALDGVTANLDAPKWDATANGGAGAYSAKHGTSNAKLTNLADGTLSTTSTDAVTGKQLNTTNTNVTNVTNQVSELTTNITEGKVGPLQRTATADKLTLVADGSEADAPGNAQVIDNLAKGTVNAASKQAVNGSQLYGVSNSVAQALGGGSGVNTDGTIKKPTYNIDGTDYTDVGSALTALDGVTANLDAPKWDATANGGAGAWSAKHGTSNAKLTNLADGTLSTTSTDAVTGKQLNTTNTNVTNVTNQVSNLTTNITEGKVGPLQRTATADKLTLVADGSEADAPGNAQVIDNLAKGTVNAASKQAVNGSQLYGVSNSVAQALGGGSSLNTDGTIKRPSYSIGGTDYTDVGSALTALDGVTANLDAPKWDATANGGAGAWSAKHGTSNAKLTNLADGTLSTTSTDAVTGKQLNATNSNVTNITNNISNGTIGPVQRSTTANTLALVEDSTKTADAPGSAQVLMNLAKGSLTALSTEAINGSQINTFGTSIANIFGGPAAFDAATGTITGASFTVGGNTYNTFGDAITAIDNSQNTFLGAGWGALTVDAANPRNNTYGSYQVDANGKITNPSVNYANNTIGTANSQVVFDAGSGNSVYFVDPLDRSKGRLPAGTRLSNVATGILETDATNVGQVMDLINAKDDGGVVMLMASRGLLGAGSGGSGINTAGLGTSYTSSNVYQQVRGRGDSVGSSPATDTARAAGAASVAIGSDSVTTAAASGGIAIGIQSYVKGKDSVAIGSGSTATDDNVVSVGTAGGVTWTGQDTNGDPVTFNNAANTRRIVNMAAGFNDTDAVNVSQLKGFTDIIGGGSTIDGDGKVVGPTYNIGGNTYTTIEAALDGIAGSTGGDALQWDTTAGAYSAAHGTSATSKITNVAAGSLVAGSVDAVNGGQINTLASNISDVIGGGGSFDPATGKIINTEFTVAGNTYSTIGDTFGAIDTSITSIDNSITNITNGKVGPVQRTATANQLTLVADGATAAAPGNAQVIDNLANGAVTAASKQAVNGSQLYGVSSSVATAFGGGSTVDANGKVIAPTYTVGTTTYDNVGGAIAALNAGGGASSVDALLWDGTAGAFSAAHGSSSTSKITNVAGGSLAAGSVDAVNGGQINTLGTNVADVLGGGGSFDPATGKIINTKFNFGGSTYDTVNQTFGAVDNAITNINNGSIGPVQRTSGNILTLVEAGGSATAPGAAQVLSNVANGNVAAGSTQAINGGQLNIMAQEIALAFGGGAQMKSDGSHIMPTFTVGANTYDNVAGAISALNSGGGTGVDAILWDSTAGKGTGAFSTMHGGVAAGITNVAAGEVSASSMDAVNGSQLYAVREGSVQYKLDTNGNKTNQVELIGGDPNAPVVLSNVASAVSDTDAVNYGQMKQAIASSGGDLNYVDNRVNSALTESKSYTDYMSQQTLQQANAYTDQKYGQLSQDISKAKTEARQAAAVGLAAASLRYDDRPGKFSTAIGGGAWHGQGAMAMGIGYTSPDGNMRANVSATTAGKNWGVGAGLSFTLN